MQQCKNIAKNSGWHWQVAWHDGVLEGCVGRGRTKEKLSPTFYVLPPLCSSLLSTNCLITSCLCPFTIYKCLKTFCCLLFKSWVLQTRHKWLPGISEISRSSASAAVQTKISWEIFNIYYWLESLKIQVPGECWARQTHEWDHSFIKLWLTFIWSDWTRTSSFCSSQQHWHKIFETSMTCFKLGYLYFKCDCLSTWNIGMLLASMCWLWKMFSDHLILFVSKISFVKIQFNPFSPATQRRADSVDWC